jgi:hypothetical protein
MNPETLDWPALERLRTSFLAGTAGTTDYWTSESELVAYDATFAQRIGWKWDFVLRELQARGWTLPTGDLLDWGCGSGVAGRAVLDHFGVDSPRRLRLWDRSPLAMGFAAQRARTKYPGLNVVEIPAPQELRGGTLVLSHVLTELTQPQTEALVELAATAECVLWVEPGTYEASLTLIAIRERLRGHFQVVAPCPHQGRCGILAPENERHWCHHFAAPPNEVFQDAGWAAFANRLNIDLRDLPVSFLVLDRRAAPPLPADATRLVGHPRLYKAHALMLGCNAAGVRERTLSRRAFPDEFKQLRKGRHASLYQWNCDGDAIVELTAWH